MEKARREYNAKQKRGPSEREKDLHAVIKRAMAVGKVKRMILVGLSLIPAIFGIVTFIKYMPSDEIRIDKKTIAQIVKDVYSPKDMTQFKNSYIKYHNTVFTIEEADDLYKVSNESLTEEDLSRECSVKVKYSAKDKNNFGKDLYIADVRMVHGITDKQVLEFRLTFYVGEADNKIYDHDFLIVNGS